MLSPQIRAVEGLTYAVKGKKVIYKTETWVLPFMSPVSFPFLDCEEVALMDLGQEDGECIEALRHS